MNAPKQPRPYKIGYGYDSHRFLTPHEKEHAKKGAKETTTDIYTLEKPLVIGGIPADAETQKLYGPFKARSDGDVLYHAVVNAILSAVGDKSARDIGTLFPNTDKKNSNRDSGDFIKKAVEVLKQSHYELADLKIMLKGKIRVNFHKVEENLHTFFKHQKLHPEIHAQGTSGEEMDAAGKGDGVEVFVVALIQHTSVL
jgi:2-C-methyl-D-erythritol 2,4-cyclodiphosphate synthase